MSVPVAPMLDRSSTSPVDRYLAGLLDRFESLDDGEVATYIPELASADPTHFGISVATLDGALYEAGDTRVEFTIQSMSKPLTYGLALERLGVEEIRRRVGVEPSGDPFNEISLHPVRGTPVNPMINAGAIACAGLVAGASEDGLEAVLDTYSHYTGRRLEIDEAVYRSESETGHRNRAIAHLLSSFDVLDVSADEAVDLYFRQCSVALDCRDLALVAATLANGGLNPLTGERAVGESVVREVLSVMTTCGMYDGAGDWLVSVGLPAKSGVSGGVFAVLPGRLGVAVYSPRLDANGNSARGVAVCRTLSHELALHLVRPGERDALPVRAHHDVSTRSSKRIRPASERAVLSGAAGCTAVFELQGELGFMAAEAISRATVESLSPIELAVVDLRRVTRVDRGGTDFLRALGDALAATGGALAVSGAAHGIALGLPDEIPTFADLDAALEWCEDELLLRRGCPSTPTSVPLAEHELLRTLDPSELERLVPELGTIEAAAGALVVRSGDVAVDVFLVTSGTLSVRAPGSGPSGRRFSTLSAGMTFGEVAYVERGPRSADVYADTDVVCCTLPFAVLDRLATSDPVVYAKLVHGLASVVVAALRRANTEAAHLGA